MYILLSIFFRVLDSIITLSLVAKAEVFKLNPLFVHSLAIPLMMLVSTWFDGSGVGSWGNFVAARLLQMHFLTNKTILGS